MQHSPNFRNCQALVTLTIGSLYEQMAELTHPLMKAYAKKCHADFVVIDRRQVNEKYGLNERYEKFQVFDLLNKYKRILFVDTDILISPDAPSLFEMVPEERFAAASEERYSQSERDKQLTQQILGWAEWRNPYFNSGVMLFSQGHRLIFNPYDEGLQLWITGEFRKNVVNLLNDQPYLNHRLSKLGIELFDLGFRFNHTRVIKETHTRFRSYFLHYAGPSGHRYGTRIEQIKKDAAVLNSPIRLWFSRKILFYRWIADRLSFSFLEYLYKQRVSKVLKWKL